MSRRDWTYLLSLIVPFIAYNLTLKALDVASQPGGPGLGEALGLMWSEVFFNLGYTLFWVGLFAVSRKGFARWVAVFFFHAATMLVVVVTTLAHQHFQQTGATLDYGVIAGWVSRLDGLGLDPFREVSRSVWVILAAALFYAAFGPPLLTRAVGWWRGWLGTSPARTAGVSFLGSLAIFLLALGFGSLSLLVSLEPAGTDTPLARDRFADIISTATEETPAEQASMETEDTSMEAVEEATVGEEATSTGENGPGAGPVAERSAADAVLSPSSRTERRNVVLVHLESTRARSTTPYNEGLKTMPFLGELAKQSLLAERAHVIVARSSKGSTAINCGVEPPHYPGPEFEPGGIPSPCLAGLLKEQGYKTVYFQSVSNAANSYWDDDLARNFGYEEFYSPDTMDTEGFQITNSFGFEEDIMLGPSEGWLRENGDEPFLAQYFTGTGHYGYDCVPNRYGYENFSEDEELDRYHNCLRMLDFFLQNLFDQYKKLGLYEDTIFVMYGDHGEGFREHNDRYMHGDTIYEEGLHIPLIIHDPKRFQGGERSTGLSSQIDVLPTVAEMLGFEVQNGEYPGYSLLHPLPGERVLRANCITDRKCMASIKGDEKYIYHYDELPDEFFDLSKDPLEKDNLADERSKEELDERREDLLTWRQRDDAEYGPVTFEGAPYRGAEE